MTIVKTKTDPFSLADPLTCAVCAGDCTTVAPVCADCVERSRWRRVADELPPPDTCVAVWSARAGHLYASVNVYGRWYFGGYINSPTHWRPLPSPPQEAKP